MFNSKNTKNARLKVTKGNLLKGTIGMIEPNQIVKFEKEIEGLIKPDYLFSLSKNAEIVFGVFEDEIEIFE